MELAIRFDHIGGKLLLMCCVALAIGLLIASCTHQPMHENTLMSMEIYKKSWNSTGPFIMPPFIIVDKYAQSQKMIADVDYLTRVDQRLSMVSISDSCKFPVDCRIVCILHRSNNQQVDTLSFGDMSMMLNNRCSQVDTTLLLTIAEQLGRTQDAIRDMLKRESK